MIAVKRPPPDALETQAPDPLGLGSLLARTGGTFRPWSGLRTVPIAIPTVAPILLVGS